MPRSACGTYQQIGCFWRALDAGLQARVQYEVLERELSSVWWQDWKKQSVYCKVQIMEPLALELLRQTNMVPA